MKVAILIVAALPFVSSAHACEDAVSEQELQSMGAAPVSRESVFRSGGCVVSDPAPPLNVRPSPGGRVLRHLENRTEVHITDYVRGSDGTVWVYVFGECDEQLGWVSRRLITCKEDAR